MPLSGGTPKQVLGHIQRRPAVPVAMALMLGIFMRQVLPAWPIAWAGALAMLILAAIITFGRAWVSSILLLGATVVAGLSLAQIESLYYPTRHITSFAGDQPRLAWLEMRIDHPPRDLTAPFGALRATPPRQVFSASIRRLKTWDGWIDCQGEALVQVLQPHPRLRQGQRIRALGMLERPGPAMNPGQFDWAGYYREQRVLASVRIAQADNVVVMDDQPTGPFSWLRRQSRAALARGFEARDLLDHALLRALMLGDNDPELRDVQEQFRRTGTSHHLAISGMHVAILGGVVFGLCRLLRVSPRTACWASLLLVVLYGIVALPSPPVVRSVLLCACFGFGILGRRSNDAIHLLAMSILAMLLYHPLDLYNAGFQLSFGTVLGLMIFTRPLEQLLPGEDLDTRIARSLQRPGRFSVMLMKLRQWTRTTIAASIVAWVVSMPLIAYHFEQLNPWAIVASIILAPIVFLALISGFAKVILTLLLPSGAGVWARIAIQPVQWMRHTVDWLASFPGADIPLPTPPLWMVCLFYALLLAMLIPWHRPALRWSVRSTSLACCVMLAILPLQAGFAAVHSHAGELRVTLLAIGAGQCAVIEPPGSDAVLVDCGSASLSFLLQKSLGPFLRHQGRRDIQSIFISHSNYDHFSAAAEVTEAYGVPEVFVAPQFRPHSIDNPPAEALLRMLDRLDRPPREITVGRAFEIGGGATIEVLSPSADLPMNANNSSLVLRLSFAGKTVLFTGDLETAGQRELLKSPERLHTDVLVAPHHGSFDTATAAFVAAVAPEAIICSNDRTLSVKQKDFDKAMAGRAVYRTHTSGAITVHISREGELEIEQFLK